MLHSNRRIFCQLLGHTRHPGEGDEVAEQRWRHVAVRLQGGPAAGCGAVGPPVPFLAPPLLATRWPDAWLLPRR